MRRWLFNIHVVIKLPSGVYIENLIDDLRAFSWEAYETLIYYSKILKDSNNKSNILKNDNGFIDAKSKFLNASNKESFL